MLVKKGKKKNRTEVILSLDIQYERVLKQKTMVAIALGIHLYPYRTEKLSPIAPMVLLYQVGE